MQDSLNMIVMVGDFNNVGRCRTLDLKKANLIKRTNPVELFFKDKAKFDTQNPIIGKLLKEV